MYVCTPNCVYNVCVCRQRPTQLRTADCAWSGLTTHISSSNGNVVPCVEFGPRLLYDAEIRPPPLPNPSLDSAVWVDPVALSSVTFFICRYCHR